MIMVMHHEQDQEPSKSYTDRTECKCESVADAIGQDGYGHTEHEGTCVGRDRMELSLDISVSEALDNRRREISCNPSSSGDE